VAKRAFQTFNKIHYILSDKSLRETYDETGLIPRDDSFESSTDWDQYWRLLFPKMTVKDIDTFLHKYIGSEDEKKDLKNIYIRFNGDLDLISNAFHLL
jgi:DnaJ family protein C protein 9